MIFDCLEPIDFDHYSVTESVCSLLFDVNVLVMFNDFLKLELCVCFLVISNAIVYSEFDAISLFII